MRNIEICYCDNQSIKRDFKQGICFADSVRCDYDFFCNICHQPKHKTHSAECKSVEQLKLWLQLQSDHLKSDQKEYESFLTQLKQRKVLNASWVLQIKKAKKILDDDYQEASGNNVLIQEYQNPLQTKKIFRIFEDEINTTKEFFKEKEEQVERLLGYLKNQQYDRFFNKTPLVKKLYRKLEQYKQFNLKEKLDQEIINSQQTENQYYNEKLKQINTLNEQQYFDATLNLFRKLRKLFKNEYLDKLYGQQLIKCKKYDDAEQYYRNKLKQNSRLFWAIEGKILMAIRKYDKALTYIKGCQRNHQGNIKLLSKKLQIQQQLGINTSFTKDKINRILDAGQNSDVNQSF